MLDVFTQWGIPFFVSFGSCIGFCVIFNICGWEATFCALGGSLAWMTYLFVGLFVTNELISYFFASLTLTFYAEIMARLRKCPVTGYMLVAILPLVPGAGIYYTMRAALAGETQALLEIGVHTLSIAGSLAVGVLMVSTLMQMYWKIKKR